MYRKECYLKGNAANDPSRRCAVSHRRRAHGRSRQVCFLVVKTCPNPNTTDEHSFEEIDGSLVFFNLKAESTLPLLVPHTDASSNPSMVSEHCMQLYIH